MRAPIATNTCKEAKYPFKNQGRLTSLSDFEPYHGAGQTCCLLGFRWSFSGFSTALVVQNYMGQTQSKGIGVFFSRRAQKTGGGGGGGGNQRQGENVGGGR